MAAVNFPDPSASPWKNPSNGVTYEYSAGTWKAIEGKVTVAGVSSIIAGDGISVDQATGDVTVTNTGGAGGGDFVKLDDEGTKQVIQSGGLGISNGTDENITFGADGSATFANSVVTGVTGTGVSIYNDGTIQSWNSGNLNTNIAADGGATFKGNVYIGNYDTSDSAVSGVFVAPSGYLSIQRSGAASASDKRFLMWHGTTETASITAGGSATFAGPVLSMNTDAADYFTYMSLGGLYGNSDGSTESFRINSTDGSATFSGDVTTSGNFMGKLHGYSVSEAEAPTTIVARDSASDISTRLFKSSYASQSNIGGAMAFRENNSTDSYIRFCDNQPNIRTWLSVPSTSGGGATGTWNISITGSAGSASTATTASTASNVNINTDNSSNNSRYVTFVNAQSGSRGISTDSALSYNPSTNRLVAGIMKVTTRFDLEALTALPA